MRTEVETPLPSPASLQPSSAVSAEPTCVRGPLLGGIELFQKLDVAVWALVLVFFMGSCLVTGGRLGPSLLGALGIVATMFCVGASIELIIETLRDMRGLGTLVGFITNGPEMLCLIVGLVSGDILFAASTPLGSNFMNPVMLIAAALLTRCCHQTLRTHPRYTVVCVGLTAALASGFFLLSESWYPAWLTVALVVTVILFRCRPPEPESAGGETGESPPPSRAWLLPAGLVLLVAGYLLDPVVSYTARHSNAPKGVIGFFILATLTSWPEFKSCLALNRRRRCLSSVLNITVSNITNIWLAWAGVLIYLMLR